MERDIATWEDLDERLRRMEHFIQNPPGPPLRLVVIDSVAHLFSDNADFQTGRSPTTPAACPIADLHACIRTIPQLPGRQAKVLGIPYITLQPRGCLAEPSTMCELTLDVLAYVVKVTPRSMSRSEETALHCCVTLKGLGNRACEVAGVE